jgi:hypothetical protein
LPIGRRSAHRGGPPPTCPACIGFSCMMEFRPRADPVVRSSSGIERKSVGDVVHRPGAVLQHQPADGRGDHRLPGRTRARRRRLHGGRRDRRCEIRRHHRRRSRAARAAPAGRRVPRRSERHHREANRLRALQQAPARGDGVRRRGEERRTQRRPRRGPGGNHDSEVAAPASPAGFPDPARHHRLGGDRRCGRRRGALVALAAGSRRAGGKAGRHRRSAPGGRQEEAPRGRRDRRRDHLRHERAVLRPGQGAGPRHEDGHRPCLRRGQRGGGRARSTTDTSRSAPGP